MNVGSSFNTVVNRRVVLEFKSKVPNLMLVVGKSAASFAVRRDGITEEAMVLASKESMS